MAKVLNNRKSGIELLRLLIMFGIVISHWGGHGSISITDDYIDSYNLVWLQISQYFGEVANCAFVLISGYFSSTRGTVNIRGLKNIVIDVKFYSVLMFIVAVLAGKQLFTVKTSILALCPIIFSQYWFVIPFLCVCLLGPWLNDIIRKLDKKTAVAFYGLQFLFILILPIIGNSAVASNITLFVFYYCIGAGLNIHQTLIEKLRRYKWMMVLTGLLSVVFICCLLDVVGAPQSYNRLIGRFTPFPLIAALGLLLIFVKSNIQSAIINKLAISTFAVYLISENANIYTWLWKDYFDNATHAGDWSMIPISIFQCSIVFLFCIVIDQIYRLFRNLIFQK